MGKIGRYTRISDPPLLITDLTCRASSRGLGAAFSFAPSSFSSAADEQYTVASDKDYGNDRLLHQKESIRYQLSSVINYHQRIMIMSMVKAN